MRNWILFSLVLVLVFQVVASTEAQQTAPTPGTGTPTQAEMSRMLAEVLSWMVGDWEGNGTYADGRQFVGQMSITSELDHSALLVRRESMNKAGGASGGLKELMVIGFDGITKKIVMVAYDNSNNTGAYIGEVKEDSLVLNQATSQPGLVLRRTFRKNSDGGITYLVEKSSVAGKEPTKTLEIVFKKKV